MSGTSADSGESGPYAAESGPYGSFEVGDSGAGVLDGVLGAGDSGGFVSSVPSPESELVATVAVQPVETSLGEGFMPSSDPHLAEGYAEVLLAREFQLLVDEVRKRLGEDAVSKVRDAYELAESCHAGQMRKSGDPYLIHPLRVARTLCGLGLDAASVVAGILHDTVEDSELTVPDLTDRFGREIAMLVDGVTKLGKVPYLSRRENQAVSFRKMLVAMSRDIRVLLVKLCDRLDNMRTLDAMSASGQRRIAQETADIFAPLARLLGVDWLRRELADLAFRYLEPVAAREIRAEMVAALTADPTHIDRGIEILREAFTGVEPEPSPGPNSGESRGLAGPDAVTDWSSELFGEVRFRASVLTAQEVHELRHRGRAVEKLRDMVTYQVITRDRNGCYLALGHVHAHFKPIPGSIRDYVALPRANRYQGLHTQVLDREGVRLYVEIRSQAMDAVAERGVVVDLQQGLQASELGWLREMMGWQDQVEDPNEFIEAVKRELFADQVFVFTPQGDLMTFPKGSTPIDFAFAVHTDVGLHAAGARINGQVVPLRYRLRQGDTVEILTDPKVEPRDEWLDLVHSSRARARIKHFLRQRGRSLAIDTGRQLLRTQLEGRGRNLDELEAEGVIAASLDKLGISEERGSERLYELIGDGDLRIGAVMRVIDPQQEASESMFGRLLRPFRRREPDPRRSPREGDAGAPFPITRERLDSGMVQLASCCSPLPGDPVVGFRVPGRGVEAHVEGCPVAVEQVAERMFLDWSEGLELERPVTVRVRTANTVGLLAEMSRAFSSTGLNIKEANCRAFEDGKFALNTFHATVGSLERLDQLFDHLREVPGVISVDRVFEGPEE
ncbi:MAG: bifunctional (p)ppGpp synthetase/guanosine-3',5'-bis(diphosphate) 3'-pyrophosphohydrolase [Myxococcales bacterium]|nr:bifunctional (p)ppGpp synthetase/guanosine-3',5'-bis(diphosphate) 3'-pyrophosphohydrolase [Myxococcales bacterium]